MTDIYILYIYNILSYDRDYSVIMSKIKSFESSMK